MFARRSRKLTANFFIVATNLIKPLKMLQEKPNNEYFITYSNSLIYEGATLAFRKKELFRVDNLPIHVPFNAIANCWIINRKQLTLSKAKSLITDNEIKVDVSDLQWNIQIQLNHVFNL